ncbi:MAG: DUF418 domain-containing protein [Pseudomonadota bacterium]
MPSHVASRDTQESGAIARPAAKGERYGVLDALRGFALLGIFAANIRFFSGWDYLGAADRVALAGEGYALWDFLHLAFIDGKFYTLFSLLFGIGFALQLSRLEGRGAAATQIYLRRTFILLGFGLIHLFVFWEGDILTPYALLGFVLLAIRGWSDRALLIAAGVSLVIPPIGYALFWGFGIDQSLGLYGVGGAFCPAFFSEPVSELRLATVGEQLMCSVGGGFTRFGFMFDTWRWPKLFAIIILGLWAGRQLVRGRLLNNSRLLIAILVMGGLSGAIVGPILANLNGIGFLRPHSLQGMYAVIAYTFAVIPLGLAYAAGFVLLWRIAGPVLNVLAAPGRMALTNYLGQTAIGLIVFLGIGFDQAGQWSIQSLYLLVGAVYVGQIVFSHLWLSRFQYGPLEWIWRVLTYGSATNMLIRRQTREISTNH